MKDFPNFLESVILSFRKRSIFRRNPIDASNGALIMAIGILLISIHSRFQHIFIFTLDIALLIIWLYLFATFLKTALKGSFRRRYLTHPVQSFAVGTWIAGTSILCLLFFKQYPQYKTIIAIISTLNGGLWIFYLFICIRCYHVIFKSKYFEMVHGILLLSTVSTQSLVIVYGNLFDNFFAYILTKILINIGIFLYIINILFILKRYLTISWNVSDDWKNTNCIIHGAISITGVAAIMSRSINIDSIVFIWLAALCLFILIEGIEVWRMFARIKRYSIHHAIGHYHVSQWARNFTFGTFYVFTMNLDLTNSSFHTQSILYFTKNMIINVGLPVLIFLLVFESILFLKATLPFGDIKVLSRSSIKKGFPSR